MLSRHVICCVAHRLPQVVILDCDQGRQHNVDATTIYRFLSLYLIAIFVLYTGFSTDMVKVFLYDTQAGTIFFKQLFAPLIIQPFLCLDQGLVYEGF